MKIIKTEAAEGLILYQDITEIVKGEFKGARFKKGHRIKAEDIPILLRLGKEHLYVGRQEAGLVHENEAAAYLYQLIADDYIEPTPVAEGKIEAVAKIAGLLKVDRQKLFELNALGKIAVATLPSNQKVSAGQKLAGTRIIPMEIEAEKLRAAKQVVGARPVLTLLPFKPLKVGLIVTGSEVAKGLIKDSFTAVIEEKLAEYPEVSISFHQVITDDPALITSAIETMLTEGADMVLCTGGMSVDPDDQTPLAIKQTGATIISHGTPVLPGSMLLLAYLGEQAIVGLPGGVLYADRTVFDLLLPRLIAKDRITKEEIADLGYGGYL